MLMICAFIYGFLDGTLNTQLIAMIGIIFPSEKDSAGAFVVWNLGSVDTVEYLVIKTRSKTSILT